MRFTSLLTHPTTLLILQQSVAVWFLVDFFLARDSATANKLFREHANLVPTTNETLTKIETITNDLMTRLACQESLVSQPTFDKLIFIVVDALGSEFIPSLGSLPRSNKQRYNVPTSQNFTMPFLEQSLAHNKAMGFVAQAETPTVTMPRIKALVSGTIPSFMDVVYNLANDVSDFHDDNLLKLAKEKGKSLVFFGDDTWLSLFDRTMFKRSRETFSFYASDYTTVDTNVTEMALPETRKDIIDWDYLILHYLGLDHIGHIFGSNEVPLITKKLLEMDEVIRQLYTNMAAKQHKTLMVVCGDHGMSREGNHGGGTRLESETAMIFLPMNQQLSIKSSDRRELMVSQIDLAATLALLTGLPIPSMSRGVVIEGLLQSLWNDNATKLICASLDNLKQLSSLLEDGEFSKVDGLGVQVLRLLERMTTNTTTENERSFIQQSLRLAHDIQTHLVKTVVAKSSPILVMLVVALVMCLSLINIRRSCIRLLMPLVNYKDILICLAAIQLPILMLGSTDFIEMEYVFWPMHSIAVFVLFCYLAIRKNPKLVKQDIETIRVVFFAITFLITALWNNINVFGLDNFGWSLPVISVIIMCNFSRQTSKLEGKQTYVFFAVGLLVFVTKVVEETAERNENYFARVALLQIFSLFSLAIISVANVYTSFAKYDKQATSIIQKMATSWMWWVFLLARSRNYVFLISNVIMEASLNVIANSMRFSPITRAIIYLQFSSNAFFGQGNTNLFSSLDIKPAFFGQTQYNIALAVPLIACSTFGAHIYWYIKLFQRIQGEKEQERMLLQGNTGSGMTPEGTKVAIKDFVDMRNFLTLGYYMFVCIVLRNHLFIWSVVSPKLVYLFVTTLTLRAATTIISNSPQLLNKLFDRDAQGVLFKRIID